jgi:hypothetical protein
LPVQVLKVGGESMRGYNGRKRKILAILHKVHSLITTPAFFICCITITVHIC